jgi:hypothetical protein
VLVIALFAPASALATSAGDQQYIDPLSGTTTSTPSAAPAPSQSAGSPAASSSASATSSSAPIASASSSTASSSSSTGSSSNARTLPYTGLNAWLLAAVGVGLLGAGVSIRRSLRGS